jgi:hypothetical protein
LVEEDKKIHNFYPLLQNYTLTSRLQISIGLINCSNSLHHFRKQIKLVKVLDSNSFYTTKINKALKSTAVKPTSTTKTLTINLFERIFKSFSLNGPVRDPSVVLLIKIGNTAGPKRPSVEFIKVSKHDGLFKGSISFFGIILLGLSGMFYLFNKAEFLDDSNELPIEEVHKVDELENVFTELDDSTVDLIELPGGSPQDQPTF